MWVLLGNSRPATSTKGGLPPLLLRLTNLLGYLFLVLVNILSSIGALGGSNADVSAKFPTPLTPSGWAFSIWGVIFALEGLGVIYQIMSNGYGEGSWKASIVVKIGYGWQAGWLFQDLWQFAFVRESLLGMWVAAIMLLAALSAFQIILYRMNDTTHELRERGYVAMPVLVYVLYKLPTAINAAWLSVATALGILIVPVSYGVNQAQLIAPAAVLAVAVTAGGIWRLLCHGDMAYGLTLVWALSAVASNGNVSKPVEVVSVVCLFVLALCLVWVMVRTHNARSSASSISGDAEAASQGGSLLNDSYNSAYGAYGDQRLLLSDSDAPIGIQRDSTASFSFPDIRKPAPVVISSAFSPRQSSEGVTVAVALGVNGAIPSGGGGNFSNGKGASRPIMSVQPRPVFGVGDSVAFSPGGGGHGMSMGGGEVDRKLPADGSNATVSNAAASGGALKTLQGFVAATPGGEQSALGVQTGRRVRFQDEHIRPGECE